jgi:hypothetical protein
MIRVVFPFTECFAHLLNFGSFPDESDKTAMVSVPVVSLYIHNCGPLSLSLAIIVIYLLVRRGKYTQ